MGLPADAEMDAGEGKGADVPAKGSLEDVLYGDPSKLTEPIKDVNDKWKLLPAFLKVRGLVKQQIDSFNHLVNHDMRSIVMAKGNQKILSEVDPDWYMKYLDIRVERPCTQEQYMNRRVTPHECRLRDMTYSAPIKVDIEYTLGRQIRVKRDVLIGRMPIMLRSDRCWLGSSDEAELVKQGECPLDPGGYFVVRGTEKVILIQEQLMRNRILVDCDNDGDVFAQVTSNDTERKTMTKVKHKKGKFLLQHNCFQDRDGINLVAALKAMGVESDQEVCQLVGGNEQFANLLLHTINDCKALKIFTRKQALQYICKRSKRAKYAELEQRTITKAPEDEAMEMLSNLVLSHVPCEQFNLRNKVAYIAVMMRRMMYALTDPGYLDDRDYYGNKRLDLAGGQLSLLFEDLLKRLNTHLQLEAKKSLSKTNRAAPFDVVSLIRSDIITQAMETAISTGCWSIKRFRMERKGASQVLSRLSFIGAIGMMTRIMSQFEKTRKVSGPRALQPSQWGMICPCDTPEGESCGLVKNLALMTHVTTEESEAPIARLAYVLGVQPMSTIHPLDLFTDRAAVVHLNGYILGTHNRPLWFVEQFRVARRAGLITDFVSVTLQLDSILIACDGGRLCRPLIVCERGLPRLKQHHIDSLKAGKTSFMDLVRTGIIEFLDVNEENNSLIAMYEKDCRPGITHLEIEPFTIMGVVSGLIPYPHHNQSPRNTYQCAMGKQAMGNMAYNQHKRMDTLLYLLVYPMRPLLTTRTIELVGFDKLGAGQNATVCVMSYSGYDIEDAIVMNKASLDRGFGRCIVNHTYKAQLKRYGNRALDRIVAPARELRKGKFQIIDDDGLAQVGEVIHPGDMYVFKQVPSNTRDPVNLNVVKDDFYREQAQRYKGMAGEKTVVDKVLLSGNDDTFMVIKTLVRHVRRPELGDKFSSRHGQKGVVGHIVPQEDMPFSERGISPDLIMNPHGFPSRMTVGKMIELLGGKAGLLSGRFFYGTAFGEPNGLADRVEDIMEVLVKHGYSYSGKDLVTSGLTGQPLECYVFMGPIYYQKLKHMVLDKVHARAKGPRVTLTRQPTEGRSRDGGLRLGEMERDCLVAYGASNLLVERLVISSDAFTAHVDTQSGLLGWWDGERQCAVSPVDKTSENMIAIQMPYACKLLFQELQAMNILPRISVTVN